VTADAQNTNTFPARTFLATIFMAGLLLSVQAQQNASEYQIKSAYLYNFAKMSQWPPGILSGPNSTLTMGVFGGHDEFVDVLRATIAGKAVNGHPIEVRRVRSAEELKSCQLIFFRASERNARDLRSWSWKMREFCSSEKRTTFSSRAA
jgi:YfiR/HmsC-like